MKNHGVDEEVHDMFEMGAETMDLPFEEKMKFEQGDDGFSFGSVPSYQRGSSVIDSASTDTRPPVQQ